MADIIDLVKTAYDNKPMDFNNSFNDLIGQRVLDALEVRKQEVAMNMFNQQPEEPITSNEIDQALNDSEIEIEPVMAQDSEIE